MLEGFIWQKQVNRISGMKSKTREPELNQTVSVIEKQLRHMVLMLNIAEHTQTLESERPGFKPRPGT